MIKIKRLVKNKLFQNILIYSFLFCVLCFFIFGIFVFNHKSFIWNIDGVEQHYIIFSKYITSIKDFLFNDGTNPFIFSFSMGLGADTLTQYSYYIVGDIFSYLGLLFPKEHLEEAYGLLIFVRLFFVGLSFLLYSSYLKKDSKVSVLGALIYTFSGFIFFASVRHPYFINPVIILPLLLLGVEKVLKENKKIFFTIIVFIALFSNFYFFYMLVVLTIIYTVVRIVFTKAENKFKFFLKKVFVLLICGIIGVLMASLIFLPALSTFLDTSRTEAFELFKYPMSYYRNLILSLSSSNHEMYWSVFGVPSIVLLLIPLAIKNFKNQKSLVTFFIIGTAFLIFPIFASFLNGFSFPYSRWSFAFTLILTFLITENLNLELKYTITEKKVMLIGLAIYFLILVFLDAYIDRELIINMFICFSIYLIIIYKDKINEIFGVFKKINFPFLLLSIFVLANIVSLGYFLYSPAGKSYAASFLERKEVDEILRNKGNVVPAYDKAIEVIKKDESFYRVTDNNVMLSNVAQYLDFNSISAYLSLLNKHESQIAKDLENSDYYTSKYIRQFSNRTKVTTILGSKYFVISSLNNNIPYGYEKTGEVSNTLGTSSIYKNKYFLPMGVIYTDIINLKDYNSLNPLEKESSLLKVSALEEKNIKKKEVKTKEELTQKLNKSIEKLQYKIKTKKGLKIVDNKIYVENNKGGKLELEIAPTEHGELYVDLKNVDFTPLSIEEIKDLSLKDKIEITEMEKWQLDYKYRNREITNSFNISAKNENVVRFESYLDKRYTAYSFDNKEVLLNLGYKEKRDNKVTINFLTPGVYDIENINIYNVTFDDYESDINNLKQNSFNINSYKNNTIEGITTSKKAGVLQISTTFNKGWEAYVDNKKVNTFISNKYFLGINIPKGQHKVKFVYKTPYLKEGYICTIVGIFSFLILVICEIFKKLKRK